LVAISVAIALVVQGSFSSSLLPESGQGLALLYFSSGVIFWRTIWSLILFLKSSYNKKISVAIGVPMLLAGRCLLTVGTQVTFVAALAAGAPAVAWSIFNVTSLIAVTLAAVFLRERPTKSELVAIVSIATLTFARTLIN
jgi:drug/metabolite transporter (DMT)-like permease